MDTISNILQNKNIQIDSTHKVNNKFERAKYFLEYIGIDSRKSNIFFVLKLCKKFGASNVYNLQSWMKDMHYDSSRWQGLMMWKLQGDPIEK